MGNFNNRILLEVIPLDNSKTVFTLNDYGKVELHLKELLDSRGMARNTLAEAIGTRFEVIDKWYKNKIEKLDLDILARICYVLDCSPADIIGYDK
jgi:Predicted transcriptional regulator